MEYSSLSQVRQRRFKLDMRKNFFMKSGEDLEWATQGSGGVLIHGGIKKRLDVVLSVN